MSREPPLRSGPTPAPLSQADIAPVPMGSFGGGAPMGSGDFSLATFLNEVAAFVPPSVMRNLWGYVNRLTAVGKFDPRQASAEIDRINAVAILLKMSVPKRKVTSKFLLDLESFIDFTKKQVYRATVPRNERELLSMSISEVVSQPRQARKKFMGFLASLALPSPSLLHSEPVLALSMIGISISSIILWKKFLGNNNSPSSHLLELPMPKAC